MMKIAILGGGGCFALNFACHLNALGIEHFGIGRSAPKAPAWWQLNHHYPYHAIHLVDQLPAALAVLDTEKPDIIINFAAQGEGAASFGEYAPDFYRTNCEGLVRLVEALRSRSYLRRFIHIGSSEVYGSVIAPASETAPLNPGSPYGVSKAAFDQHLQIMHRVHDFPMNIIRPSNCYTPGQQVHRIIPRAIICALYGQKLQLQGGGNAQKSYLHADDLSRAIMAVLENGKTGAIYNVGSILPIRIRILVERVGSACAVPFTVFVEEAPERTGQDSCYWLDSSRIGRECGWKQEVSLDEGLTRMVAWVSKYPELQHLPAAYIHRR